MKTSMFQKQISIAFIALLLFAFPTKAGLLDDCLPEDTTPSMNSTCEEYNNGCIGSCSYIYKMGCYKCDGWSPWCFYTVTDGCVFSEVNGTCDPDWDCGCFEGTGLPVRFWHADSCL